MKGWRERWREGKRKEGRKGRREEGREGEVRQGSIRASDSVGYCVHKCGYNSH